jgi:hypothetical protein
MFGLTTDYFDGQSNLLRSSNFADVPISVNSRAIVSLDPGATTQTLRVDINGDGVADYQVQTNQRPTTGNFVTVMLNIVATAGLPRGIEQDLSATLQAASASISRGNTVPARNQLGAFQSKVRVQSGKALSATLAASLESLVGKAIAALP